MIAVWIVAVAFLLVGSLYSLPRYYKLLTCRCVTTGKIVETRSSTGADGNGSKAKYEYYVDGKRYEANTGWTTFARFSRNMEYKVKYNLNKPQISFMNYSGMYINTVLGTVFLFTGIGVFFIGILLKSAGF